MTETHEEKKHDKGDDKPIFTITKGNVWKITSAVLAILLIWSLWHGPIFGDSARAAPSPSAPSVPSAAPSAPSPAAVVDVSADDDPVMGKAKAPVTIIEFSDYQCPFCSRFYTQTLPQLKSEYIDTGKASFVYRDFPLTSIHPEAKPAAIAANCAEKQGKYWEMHDKIFTNQQSLSSSNYKAWAGELGLDAGKFESCLNDPAMGAEVDKDLQDGASAGVQGTPAFFINGRLLSGAQPFSAFKAVIDAELAK
ncbi:DsbA family protein [Candidatus Woesearchaeota archaeon]|nr:DsbA family protein [Candidatus Woesearchaeota archaeon]